MYDYFVWLFLNIERFLSSNQIETLRYQGFSKSVL